MKQFEEKLHQDLYHFLLSMKKIDEHLPACPDVEAKWEQIAESYIPDGIKEFNSYPISSLGWMMYMCMAVAQCWDVSWDIYGKIDDLYVYMRNKRGYDNMDEYICEEILSLTDTAHHELAKIVGECASRTFHFLQHQYIEPGTKDAFDAYVSCLHQLYLMGIAMQLKQMGYYMSKME